MGKCYSTNGEEFNYDDIEDAIRDAFDDPAIEVGAVVIIHEGDAVPHKAGDFAPTDIIDTLACGAGDDGGEFAGDWPDCTRDQEKDLKQRVRDAVNQWADEHDLHPTFYGVANSREIWVEMTDEDGGYKILEG